jgi:HlyD family secretion protein
MRAIAITSTALAIALVVAGCARKDDAWEVHGTLERDRLELVAESHERIIEVAIREGDHVVTDAVLVRQEAGTMQPRLDQARASVDEAERRLAELQSGPRQREIDEARAAVAGAESTLQTETTEYERVRSLVERKLVSASSLDQARARRDTARSSRDQAQARLKLLLEGTRSEQVQQSQAAVARSKAALAELETTASRYVVRAPRAGVVEALPYKLGERPPAGAPVAVILADGTPYARVYVPEPLRASYTAGARVQLRIDGIPQPLAGTVRYVSAEASFTPYNSLTQKDRTRLSYLAEITVDDPKAADLPSGIPVQVTLGGAR